ncbi:MAG TPA: hypothetical protein VFD85_06625 [Gemmatimonadales bacterium]|nr:hypothetical protein [Gemmatimonadales bacterium]
MSNGTSDVSGGIITSMARLPDWTLAGLAIFAAAPAPGAAQSPVDVDARGVMAAAIARRQATLAGALPCRYDAYIKTAAFDLAAPPDSAASVLLLTESEITAYWQSPDRFQETIDARHRPGDGGIGRPPATVDEIEHYQRDFVTITDGADPGAGGTHGPRLVANTRQLRTYQVPLPVGREGLRDYDFPRLDTIMEGTVRILRIVVRGRGATPRFDGTVDLRDSTYDVIGMDLLANAAVRYPGVSGLRYQEVFSDTAGGTVPSQIRLSGHLERRLSARWLPRTVAGMPMPEFPRSVQFEEVATLSGFRSDSAVHPPDIAEVRRISRVNALRSDTGMWSAPGAAPLSPAEQAAWAEQDSLELHPRLVPRVVRDAERVSDAAFGPGFGHYNRVDGLYFGVAHDWRVSPTLQFSTKLGYALGRKSWQYRAGTRVTLSQQNQLWVGATYHDESSSWPSLVPVSYDATASAFVNRVDPNEYYRDHGLLLSAGIRVLPYTRVEVRYDDAHQSTLDTLPNSGFRPTRFPPVPNPPITDGHLRLIGGMVTFDSRQLVRSRLGDGMMAGGSWTSVAVRVDVSAHDILGSDYSFRRYSVRLEHQQRWGNAGVTTLTAVGGLSTGFTPPQQYFTLGYGIQVLAAEGSAFNTLARGEFAGTRAAMILLRHDFGRLPLVPATLSLHGGAFWSVLHSELPAPGDTTLFTAGHPYTEAGFTLGHLTPFLTPLDIAVSCTWQLSHYPTHPFRFGIGFTGF